MSGLPTAPGVTPRPPQKPAMPASLPQNPVTKPAVPVGTLKTFTNVSLTSKEDLSMKIGVLTTEILLGLDQQFFEKFEPLVEEIVTGLQEQIKDSNLSTQLSEARLDRGDLYVATKTVLENKAMEFLSSTRKYSTIEPKARNYLIGRAVNELIGIGPLEPLWADPEVTDIMVNGPERVRISKINYSGTVLMDAVKFWSEDHLIQTAGRILEMSGRQLSPADPIKDGRLPDKSRIAVAHKVISPSGTMLTIRRHGKPRTIQNLVENGVMTEEMAQDLALWVGSRCTVGVVGGTGSGKTTVLNALSGLIPRGESLITIEDNLELQLHPECDVRALETRDAGPSGAGGVSMADLLKFSLRSNPDRIIVGEVRDGQAYEMLQAANTGHEGSLTTWHANGPDEAVKKIVDYVGQSGKVPDTASRLAMVSSSIDIIVIVKKYDEDGSRRISGIYEVPYDLDDKGQLKVVPLWEFEHTATDPDTFKVIGHFEKKNDISPALAKIRGIDKKPLPPIEKVYEISKLT